MPGTENYGHFPPCAEELAQEQRVAEYVARRNAAGDKVPLSCMHPHFLVAECIRLWLHTGAALHHG